MQAHFNMLDVSAGALWQHACGGSASSYRNLTPKKINVYFPNVLGYLFFILVGT